MILYVQNIYRIYGLTIIRAGDLFLINADSMVIVHLKFGLNNMQIRFVGATIGRPLQLPEFHADNQ